MITIISNSIDKSTDLVCEYLENESIGFLRINLDNLFSRSKQLPYEILKRKDIILWIKTISYLSWKHGWKPEEYSIVHSIIIENIYSFILLLQKSAKLILGYPIDKGYFFNKVTSLEIASSVNLEVPRWHFVYCKSELLKYHNRYKLITKPSSELINIDQENYKLKSYTAELSNKDIQLLDENFGLSFIQEKISKEFDVKIVYLDGATYCFGIKPFEMLNMAPCVDFRQLNDAQLNFFSFDLSKSLMGKIRKYMVEIKANYGVLDFILGKNGKMYFLEFNPYGNFNNMSGRSNIKLEINIAKWLAKQK